MAGALDGIRVLDFGRYIAGPWCAALLGDLGAEVIRVDKRAGSEDRFVGPVADGGEGALYLQANRNKRGMTLDPMKPAGREVVRRLLAQSDVVIANLPPQSLAAMGLDWPTVSALNPAVVLTTISAFGSGGPYERRLGFDGIGQAMSGSMYLSGHPGEPMKAYVPWVDFGTATNAALATVAALYARRATGRGQHVEASLLQTALTVSNSALVEQRVRKLDRVASANRSQIAGPSDAFRTADGWLLAQVIGQPLFERWCKLVGATELLSDPRFASDPARGDNGALLSERMGRWCAGRNWPRRSPRSKPRAFPPARSTRRSRPSTIRTCARRRSCATARSPGFRWTRRSRTRRSGSRRAPRGSAARAAARRAHGRDPARAGLSARRDHGAAPGRVV